MTLPLCNLYLYVFQKGPLKYIDNLFLLSINLGGCLPELNEYDHVCEGGAKDTGD